MIWLASFPRSGNTFFRNILFEVYGIESSTYHKEGEYPVDPNYTEFQVVKTHLQPGDIEPSDRRIPAVYLVRDGRDSIVSISHHRKDIVAPGSDYRQNMLDAIWALEGSFFGGWSRNAQEWIERADIVIRYEDLVEDPIGQVERLRAIMDLPEPNVDKLPTFQKLKSGEAQYGSKSRQNVNEQERQQFAKKFFRRGKSGAWKDEMPADMHRLFWENHGEMMNRLGYTIEGDVETPAGGCNRDIRIKLGLEEAEPNEKPVKKRVLIEASKLKHGRNDGVGRYVLDLAKELYQVQKNNPDEWSFDLSIDMETMPIESVLGATADTDKLSTYEGPIEKVFKLGKRTLSAVLPEKTYASIILFAKNNFRKKKAPAIQHSDAVESVSNDVAKYDLIHVTLPQNYWLIDGHNAPYLCTIHDMTHRSHPDFHVAHNREICESGLQSLMQKESHFIAVSKATQDEFIRFHADRENQISLVYEGVDRNKFRRNLFPDQAKLLRAHYRIGDRPYFLTLSTIEPRKNTTNIISAFQRFKKQNPSSNAVLVCAGNKGWIDRKEYKSLKANKDVIFTGFVEDEMMSVLLSEAVALCYVSHFEGFGLPILEAMACSTPVICGNNSSQPEVGGKTAFYADADDPESIAEQMTAVHNHPNREQLEIDTYLDSWRFSNRKMACETLDVYRRLIQK
jgi:glycosyltransferase involved in cell wall biosynthesis